ncbi:hypothetical protein K502DRAFT_290803 [Neoconidiobolus thromboides FSU 785]|nr:hypothetical protein K502DRAFT_290803 [Neoconidiobolus thromboides FSU 785]
MVRVKRRYFLFEVALEDGAQAANMKGVSLNKREVQSQINRSIAFNFGSIGSSKIATDLNLQYFNPETKIGLLRTNRENEKMVCASLTLLNEIKGTKCCFTVLKTTATIKKLMHASIKRDKKLLLLIHKFKYQELIEEEE